MRLITLFALLAPLTAVAVPLEFTHQGRLTDAEGVPLEGTHALTITLYDDATSTSPLWTDTIDAELKGGAYAIVLGNRSDNAIDSALFAGGARWVGIAVDGNELPQRQPITSVPFAIRAHTAENVQGGIVDASEIRVNGTVVIDGTGALAGGSSWEGLTGVPEDVADGDDDTLADLGCGLDQMPVFDGDAWTCASRDIDAADITTGVIDIARIPTGTSSGTVLAGDWRPAASDIGSGVLDIARLPLGTGPNEVASGAHTHDAAAIVSGSLSASLFPVGTTSGTLAAGDHRHDASHITGGTFDAARIPGLDAAKITSGAFDAARIPNLDAAKIASGTLAKARLPTLTAADVSALPVAGGTVTGDLDVDGTLQVGTSTDACSNSASHGKLRFTSNTLQLCTTAGWKNVAGGRDGSSSASAGTSCKQIKQDQDSLTSGVFWINPTGSQAYQVWCDMTTRGGGWTLVMKANGAQYEHNNAVWTTTNVDNDSNPSTAWANAKYRAFNDLPAGELLLVSQGGNDTHLALPNSTGTLLSWFQRNGTTLLTHVGGSANANHLVNGQNPTICGRPFRINGDSPDNNFNLRLGGYFSVTWSCGYGNDSTGQPTSAESAGFGLRDDTWSPFQYALRGFGVRQAHDANSISGGGQFSTGGAIYVR